MSLPSVPPPIIPSAGFNLWHNPSLLASILQALDTSSHEEPEKYKEPDVKWTADVARVMRTSKYGLDIGAGVLYRSETMFPWDADKGRFDMRVYLKGKECPQKRIDFYCSKVKIMKVLDLVRSKEFAFRDVRRSSDTTMDGYRDHFQKLISFYPALDAIQLLVDGVSVLLHRKPSAGIVYGLRVGVYCGESASEGCISNAMNQLSRQFRGLNGTQLPVTTLRLHSDDTYWSSDSPATPSFGFSLPGNPYASLLNFTTSPRTFIKWDCLKQLLDRAPNLSIIDVRIRGDRRSINNSYQFSGKSYASVKILNIHLLHLPVEDLFGCMELFPQLLQLEIKYETYFDIFRLDANEIQIYDEEKPRRQIGVPDHKRMHNLINLDIQGRGITNNIALDLLDYCPSVTSLTVSCGSAAGDQALQVLQGFASACPNICDLIYQTHDSFVPFLPAVDLLVESLPHLKTLALSVTFPEIIAEELRGWMILRDKPRWPTLRVLHLTFSGDYQTSGKAVLQKIMPFYQSAAVMLDRFLANNVAIRGREAFRFSERQEHRNVVYYGAQWWEDVSSAIAKLRKDSAPHLKHKAWKSDNGKGKDGSDIRPCWALVEVEGEDMKEGTL